MCLTHLHCSYSYYCCVLVLFNFASKQRLFYILALTNCFANMKQNPSNKRCANRTVTHYWPLTEVRETHSAGCQRLPQAICFTKFEGLCLKLVTILMLEVSVVQCRSFPSLSVGRQPLCGFEETTYHLPWWAAANLSYAVRDTEDLKLWQWWRLISISTS